ncbi:MAG: TonB-dependent receptor plug domain-containing protein [Gemmatimonadetes bacterium]|nr:TonB-dependent receptor plug domain-containing protein [Gemmatimonadota bacterium]
MRRSRICRFPRTGRGWALCVLALAIAEASCASRRLDTPYGGIEPDCDATTIASQRDLEGATLGDVLQGRVPGLNIVQVGGAAGGGVASIRGRNSLYSGQPLVYLDNIRMTEVNSTGLRGMHSLPLFEYVNVGDIDRIEILRGPAATLEYGSAAADGVIRIYTKRGRGDDATAADSTASCIGKGSSNTESS